MKCLLLLANGFEDHEGLTTRDVLLRSGIDVITASITKNLLVTTSHNIKLYADVLINEIDCKDFDGIIIPGGKKGVMEGLDKYDLKDIFSYFIANNKLISAICAGPYILGKYGLLNNKDYTCFPGFNNMIKDGNYHIDKGVVKDQNIITGKSMYYTIDFALEIVKYLKGDNEEALRKLRGE